jgi:hypothetical protein
MRTVDEEACAMRIVRTWVVVIAAVLLAACDGTGTSNDLSSESAGTVADIRRPVGDGFSMAYDAGAKVVVAVDPSGTWLFDVSTDRWVARAATAFSRDGAATLIYSPKARGVLAVSSYGNVFSYDVAADTWTLRPGQGPSFSSRLVGVDEESGDVVAIEFGSAPKAWSYDVASGEWTELKQAGAIGVIDLTSSGGPLMTYDPGVSGFLVMNYRADHTLASTDVWRFDPQGGTWTALADMPFISFGYFPLGGEATYSARSGRAVFASDGVVAEYDAATDSWTAYMNGEIVTNPKSQLGTPRKMSAALVYDPTKERVLMYGGRTWDGTDWKSANDMWAYDTTDHTWSLVLEASQT